MIIATRDAAAISQLGGSLGRVTLPRVRRRNARQLCGNRRLYFHLCGFWGRSTLRAGASDHSREEFRTMTDQVRRLFSQPFTRRRFLATSAAVAGTLAVSSLVEPRIAFAAGLKTVRFSEAVHNLGYI